jgi:hypothetical protein
LVCLEETVDRREGEVGELQIAGLHVPANPRGQPAGDPHGDPVLRPADGGEGDRRPGVQRLDELAEGPLVDAAHRSARRFTVQTLGGLDHLLVQAFGQEEPELFGGRGHGELGYG